MGVVLVFCLFFYFSTVSLAILSVNKRLMLEKKHHTFSIMQSNYRSESI